MTNPTSETSAGPESTAMGQTESSPVKEVKILSSMVHGQSQKTCENCGEGIPLRTRICPLCNEVPEEFRDNLALCECGEYNVRSLVTANCWNCNRPVIETLPPEGEWFCKRCGDLATNMGGTICENCWDYFEFRRAKELGVSLETISVFSPYGDPSTAQRKPDCEICAKRNESWRSFCISCGNNLVSRPRAQPEKKNQRRGIGCMIVLGLLTLSAAVTGALLISSPSAN